MSVFDPDSIAYGKREAESEEELEAAIEEAIALVTEAYMDALASFAQHEADFNESQISAGRWAVFSHFLRAGVGAVVATNATHKEQSE